MLFNSFLSKNKTILKYLSSSFLSFPISLISGFITLRNIDPHYMGIWAAFTVFETYANFLRFGIINGLNRELPYALGKGKTQDAIQYAETTLYFTLLCSVLLFIIIPVILWINKFDEIYLIAGIVFMIKVSLTYYTSYIIGTFRSNDHFNRLSNIQITSQISRLFFCGFIFFGFYGFLAYDLIFNLFLAGLLHYYRPLKIKPVFNLNSFKHLIKIGFPIFITSYLIGFIDTIPRMYIIQYGTTALLGLLAPTTMMLNLVNVLPNSISSYLYPKFLHQYGINNNPLAIWQKFLKVILLLFGGFTLLAFIGFFLLDYFVSLFPKYTESFPYLKVSLLICPFIFFKLGNMMYVIFNVKKYMFIFIIAYATLQVLSLWVFSLFVEDMLYVVIYSQIATSILMMIINFFQNKVVVNSVLNQNHN